MGYTRRMDELELSGRRHISAKRAAKEHRYHSDYIGQLIRSNKVAGQKVGRSWYVDAASLDAYLKGEAQPAPAAAPEQVVVVAPAPVVEIKKEEPAQIEVVRSVPVRPVQPVVVVEEKKVAPRIVQPVESFATAVPEALPGLRFMPDEPMAPVHNLLEEQPVVDEEELQPRRRSGVPVALTVLGLCAFSLAFSVSYVLAHKTTVAGEQVSASLYVTLSK